VRLVRKSHGNWSCLRCSGKNGLFMVLMVLAWWGNASHSHTWDQAVDDVAWEFAEMVGWLRKRAREDEQNVSHGTGSHSKQ
jgi:hypothetical protein